MLREIGFTYKFLEEKDIYLPLIEAHLKYHYPARYDDLLTIKTVLKREKNKFLRVYIDCCIFQENRLITSGSTVHVMSNSSGKPVKAAKEIQVPLFERVFSFNNA